MKKKALMFVLLVVLLSIPLAARLAMARAGGIDRVSVSSSGEEGNGQSGSVQAVSSDGRYVAFWSQASNLVPGDTNGTSDIFVRDCLSGTTERVNLSSTGQQIYTGYSIPDLDMSSDGRFVVFSSGSNQLVSGDTNGAPDIFIRDRFSGTTEVVSLTNSGQQAMGGSSFMPSISADGRYVVFTSYATNLTSGDTNGRADVFVRDRVAGTTQLVSVSSSETQANANGAFWTPSISDDGRYVTFCSEATNLVSGDTNGWIDVFVRDRLAGTTERVSVSALGEQGNHASAFSSISPDGKYVAFHSNASNLVDGDSNGRRDVFITDLATGDVERVSISDSGVEGNQDSSIGQTLAIVTDGGRYVVFSSLADNLVAGDGNQSKDVFIRDRVKGTTERVSVSDVNDSGNGGGDCPSISPDGTWIVFSSGASNLVPGDTNGTLDCFIRENDRTCPTSTISLSGTTGSDGWFISDVTASITATDDSGVDPRRIEYSLDGIIWQEYSAPLAVSREGTSTVWYRAIDAAGNVEVPRQQEIRIDKTVPGVQICSPGNGVEYLLNQALNADWLAADHGSGVSTSSAAAVSGASLDTGNVGQRQFSVDVTDSAGNHAVSSTTYFVRYSYCPTGVIDSDGDSLFDMGAGRMIPLRFELKDAIGSHVGGAVASVSLARISDEAIGTRIEEASTGEATAGNRFVYDSQSGQYAFDLSMDKLTVGTWRITIQLDDGTDKSLVLSVR